MEIQYDFSKYIQPKINEPIKISRPNHHIVRCCSNCKWAWFAHSNERRGFCRLNQYDKKPPNRETAHPAWAHIRTHSTMICSHHTFRSKKLWNDYVTKWVGLLFDTNGNSLGPVNGKDDN